ncbi:MAG: Cytidylate kinase [Tenericutes bacterium ADurb.Bin239]|nr:MAG: Cytidylate kinase [Tenericutes bacterium ADurb.Bin239]
MRNIAIAIDGPAAAGKSTIAKKVAKHYNFVYIDTGAMYRAFTWYVLKRGLDPQDEEASNSLIPEVKVRLTADHKVFVNDTDVSSAIREPNVSGNVSYIASYPKIRLFLTEQQREMAKTNSVVMDGRDIGTYVLPNADVKIFQTASVAVRAKRRYLENLEKGINTSLEEIEKELTMRDHIDSTRAMAPLKKADDAFALDTDDLSIDEVVAKIIKIVDKKIGVK